jgi:hypothetical protein
VLFFIMESSETLGVPTSCNILHAHYDAVLCAAHVANEIQLLYSTRERSWLLASLQLHPEILFCPHLKLWTGLVVSKCMLC